MEFNSEELSAGNPLKGVQDSLYGAALVDDLTFT